MRLSKITLSILITIIILSMFASKISNIISVNYDYVNDRDEIVPRSFDPGLVLSDETKHLMWFVQISDIHLSIFHDPGRIADFNEFCNTTLNTIRPTVVLASGDLADAKQMDSMGSRQFIQEWKYYQEILQKNGVEEKTVWLDIRGNHDNFDVPSLSVTKSHYHHHSIQGKRHLRSYMDKIEKDDEVYSFIAVDACLDPGPRRPFNFIGLVTPEEFQTLQGFERESRTTNGTVWFGHYPTSTVISPEPGLRKLMRNGNAYMCGHLHTLAGSVPNMYTLHHTGLLELELGDWKDNRLYRVAAFDHGLFAFTDVEHGKWPVVLVTNPKHALFNLPKKEPLDLMKSSTHIRLLVFSPSKMEVVRVKIDKDDWIECQNVEGPLFVGKWDPAKYSVGLHEIKVYARNIDGEATEISQPFSLDGTKLSFRLLPRIALMLDAARVFYHLFVFMVVVSVLPLVGLRVLHVLVKDRRLGIDKFRLGRRNSIIRKLWLFVSVDKLFYPAILYPLYVTIGPWFIGEVLEDHYGVVFAWGTFVHGKVLPGSFTYFYGFFQLLVFHVPFVLLLSHCVDCRFKSQCWEGSPCCYTGILFQHLPCLTYIVIQALFAYSFWLAYGTMAFIVGPLRTWSVFMAFMLWITAATLRSSDFESVSAMFIKGPSNGDKYSPATIAVTNSNNSDDNGTVRVNNPQEQL